MLVYTGSIMRASDVLVESLLKKGGVINADQLKKLGEQAAAEKKTLQELVIQTNKISEVDLTKLYAKEIDVPFAEFVAGSVQIGRAHV